MDVTLLTTCKNCEGAKALKDAAISEGYTVRVEVITRSDERTSRSAESGIGLPVLVDQDGNLSDDGKSWTGKKKRIKVTHPVGEVVDNVDADIFE